jgi:hypothetical protein
MKRSIPRVIIGASTLLLLGFISNSPLHAQNSCADAAVNLDWQWTANSPPQNKRYDWSPAYSLDIYWHSFRYDPQHGLIANNSNPEASIMATLGFGQKHNPNAQKTYTDCRKSIASIHALMRLVVTAAPGRSCDLADAEGNIKWQAGANSPTVTDAKRYWTQGRTAADPNAKLYFGTLAADSLMHGQMHNPPVIQEYRACFRDNPAGLFSIVFKH